jgi:GNAT superfamily N-acetyltransferase
MQRVCSLLIAYQKGSPMTFTLRRGTASDREPIAELHYILWHESQAPLLPDAVKMSRDRDYFRSRAAIFTEPPLVAELNGRIVAFASWDGAYVGQMFILPEVRGQGLGSALLKEAEAIITATGATEARFVLIAGDVRGWKFFEKNGWRLASERPLVIDTPEGVIEVKAWDMAKTLGPVA